MRAYMLMIDEGTEQLTLVMHRARLVNYIETMQTVLDEMKDDHAFAYLVVDGQLSQKMSGVEVDDEK